MKIKPVIDVERISELTRYNSNTTGTHLFIDNGELSEAKKDYANLVLVSLMYDRGFLKDDIKGTIQGATEVVNSHENGNTMGL